MVGAPIRVLVIDDDEVTLAAVREILEEAGYDVRTMASAVGAADVILREGIDAAVIDMNMPLIGGDAAIAQLRSRASVPDIALVLLSGERPERLFSVRERFPNVGLVSKRNMRTQLASALARSLNTRQK